MKRTEGFEFNSNRYKYDFRICSSKKGWCQIDTEQDAHYFGMWCNPQTLKIFTYAEGDTYSTECENTKEFKEELEKIVGYYEKDFNGIDCRKDQRELFIKMGCGDLLYPEL